MIANFLRVKINHESYLLFCLNSTIQERAVIVSTWIDIAQELRILKNFSSLKAIVSGLQSNAIYRLSKMWAALPREKVL